MKDSKNPGKDSDRETSDSVAKNEKSDSRISEKASKSSDDLKTSEEDPKPRIVLTFRSEKPGLKSSNMKIVSNEEKNDDGRRSTRTRDLDEDHDKSNLQDDIDCNDDDLSPKKSDSKSVSQSVSESDEPGGDSTHVGLKRPTRRRSKEYSENVLANAIARKEKSYDTSPTTNVTRLSRRIKPTAKVLANKELRQGLETQNNARLGISAPNEKAAEGSGIQTRRSIRRKSVDNNLSDENSKAASSSESSPKKRRLPNRKTRCKFILIDTPFGVERYLKDELEETQSKADSRKSGNKTEKELKKKHLGKLGLKEVYIEAIPVDLQMASEQVDDSTMDSTNTEVIAEQSNEENTELENDKEQGSQTSKSVSNEGHEAPTYDSDDPLYECYDSSGSCYENDSDYDTARNRKREGKARRSGRSYLQTPVESPAELQDDDQKENLRRSGRKKQAEDVVEVWPPVWLYKSRKSSQSDVENTEREPAEGDEGSEAAYPEEDEIFATCFCDKPSNLYVTPSELKEPVFCRAVESVDGLRVGCSHSAAKEADGSYAPLLRAGPRCSFFLACRLHAAQLRRHMCCTACGLFCCQGVFYQCSQGHLFHLDCGLPYGETKVPPGCPHCGFINRRPANKKCDKVKVEMKCSNKRIFLPDQRVQCMPAYLSFSKLSPDNIEQGPIIPSDLLPSPPINLQKLREKDATDYDEVLSKSPPELLCDVIVSDGDADQIISRLVTGLDINQHIDSVDGGTFLHLAAKQGNITAVYLLHYAGAALDITDSSLRTPLMIAVIALLEKSTHKQKQDEQIDIKEQDSVQEENIDNDESKDKSKMDLKEDDNLSQDSQTDDKSDDKSEVKSEITIKSSENTKSIDSTMLMKVIRYLVAAGCDVNFPGPEGMTALHMAAQYGGVSVCAELLRAQNCVVDSRDHGGWTPLVWAAENKHTEVVRLLLSREADPATCDVEGNAVLHWCALAGDSVSLQLLLDVVPLHAIDALNAHGDTPLHVAARQNHYSCVVILLARGARADIENSNRELAVEVCSAQCQSIISLNMQMALAVRDRSTTYRLLSSDISNGREHYPVPCVNEVDEESLPTDFIYVTQHMTPQTVTIDTTISTMQGCNCLGDNCGNSNCTCCVLGIRRWYTRGRLVPSFPFHDPPMLFECNQTCKCNIAQCCNAVVTRASKRGSVFVRAQVFRCGSTCGWGLRAQAPILRGTPVATYCGELLPVSLADKRAQDHYMFALDLKPDLLDQCDDKSQLCVDAAVYGNAARFINHSCRPNLAPVRVFTSSRDLRLPIITLFATRDIRALEELTFDYGDKFWSVKSKWMKCECGYVECRYPKLSAEDTSSIA